MQGALIPEYHLNYWMGLKNAGSWPNFTWMDPFAVGPNSTTYEHWGKGEGFDFPAEPNNFESPEDCGVANYTQSFDGVWGWSDGSCKQKFVFLCKIRGGSCALNSCKVLLECCHSARADLCCCRGHSAGPSSNSQSITHAPALTGHRPPLTDHHGCPADPCTLAPPSITTSSTNATFQLLTCPRSRTNSQKQCNKLRAHLATYTSIGEQQVCSQCWRAGASVLSTPCGWEMPSGGVMMHRLRPTGCP